MIGLVQRSEIGSKIVLATTSLKIAEVFGKLHKHVIRDIEAHISQNWFNESNFGLVDYKDKKGELRKMYILDEKFTTFLIMGFTGKEAAKWKLLYIDEFHRMREELSKPKVLSLPHVNIAIPRVKGDSQALAHKRNTLAFSSAFYRIKGYKPSEDDIKLYVSGLNRKIYGTHEKKMRDENTLLGQMIVIRSLDLITERLPKTTNIGNTVDDSIKEIKTIFIAFEPQILLAYNNNESTLQISA